MMHPVDYAPSQDFGDNPTSILPASHWIIQQFGNYQPDGHTGTDYPCPIGTPVRAVADGTVLHVGWYGGTYADNAFWISPGFAGYCYVVDHGAFIGIYGHCRDGGSLVHAGQRVTEGQILGPSGNTGASTGPHLHFEALPDGYVLNSFMYGRINPATLFGGITTHGTATPIQEDDMPTLDEIWNHPIEDPNQPGKSYPAKEWLRMTNIKADKARAAADAVPSAVLYEQRVDGRNLFDWLKQIRADVVGIQPGSVDVAGIAKALAEQLPQADAEALVDALAKRLAK